MKKTFSIAALVLFAASAASAIPFHSMGPRAVAMGGSGVALAQGPLASYWNPAGLGQLYNTSGFILPVGFRAAFTGGILEGANNMFQLNQDCRDTPGVSPCTTTRIIAALDTLGQPDNGAHIEVGGAAALKIKKGAIFLHSLTYVGLSPQIDNVNTGACSGAGCIDTNTSKLILRGITTAEIGFGMGHEILETGIVVGANAKLIAGRVGYNELLVVQEDPSNGSFSEFKDNTKATVRPAFDVGVLWDMRETLPFLPFRPRIGVVGRNINSPKFTQSNAAFAPDDAFVLDAQYRAGVALSPFKFWHIVMDLDITDNDTMVEGFRSRMLGIGTEINLFNSPRFNLPFRAGIQKNVSKDGNEGLAFTGGFGLNFLHLMFDIGGSVSTRKTTLQSEGELQNIPNNFSVSTRFALLFGGKDEGARNK